MNSELETEFGTERGKGLRAKLWPPPRPDGVALGFGLAFVFFGVAGLARAAGAEIHAAWFYPAILVGLGVAGLISLMYRRRAGP